jgi:glycogen phosphorylase
VKQFVVRLGVEDLRMKPIRTFTVVPRLPAPLSRLRELALNLHWAWNHDTIELFRRLDSELWETSGHNPVLMLGGIEQRLLEDAAVDDSFITHLERVRHSFDEYVNEKASWFSRACGARERPLIAYFCAEFGLTECLSIFAGGLGILAGDHLKSASDLGVPLVGVGLLYQQGYFRQYLNPSGWQQEEYEDNDFHSLPLLIERRDDGRPVTVEVAYPEGTVTAQVWSVRVGRVRLYLLDTNIPANSRSEDRDITDQLYGGDLNTRIRQEILLGIGGHRALEALGLEPTVYHMNEGHSVFLAVERTRRLMEKGQLSFSEARTLASASLVFTTHTPVQAGHDHFPPTLMDHYFGQYFPQLGITWTEFLGLGRRNPSDEREDFSMTVLALRMAAYSNGVSRLHGEVSRGIWGSMWPGLPTKEVPITHVTNGVHFRSWISLEMNQLYDRYLGPSWREHPVEKSTWQRVEKIPAEELWRTHERRRVRLVAFARTRLRKQLVQRGVPRSEIETADEVLDGGVLTIGFARRFATYKRAALILRDPDRLARILNNSDRPVQIIFAGKAHPKDDAGKELIRQIVALARQTALRRRIVFLEDYDMSVARYLVQGADVWLNTPLRPNEASGTSGMKAIANGVLNLSIPDGWWEETSGMSRNGEELTGWTIGRGEIYDSEDYQDQVEASALYDILEQDVVPAFYDRRADGLPRRWIGHMKSSIGSLCWYFNTNRMVREYCERFYLKADAKFRDLSADDAARAKTLAGWMNKVGEAWSHVRLEMADLALPDELLAGEKVCVRAHVNPGKLTADDLMVELYLGRLNADGEIVDAISAPMEPVAKNGIWHEYQATISLKMGSGMHGLTARALCRHPDLSSRFIPGIIAWSN